MTKTALMTLTSLATMAIGACAPEASDPSMRPSWHWEDATGTRMSTGEAMPVIVDEAGLAWTLNPGTGLFGDDEPSHALWLEEGCSGTGLTYHPTDAMEPFQIIGTEGWFYLPTDGPPPEAMKAHSNMQPEGCSSVGGNGYYDLPDGVRVADLVKAPEGTEPPSVSYVPPFHRSR